MKDAGWQRWGLNLSVLVLGALVVVLLYSLAVRTFSPRVDPRREDNPQGFLGEIIQVEVRNGCGEDGVAGTTSQYLKARGFDVVNVGDHTTFDLDQSLVVDRVGDLETARKVAAALGIDEAQVRQEIRTDYYLDASVIVGRDYNALRPFRAGGG